MARDESGGRPPSRTDYDLAMTADVLSAFTRNHSAMTEKQAAANSKIKILEKALEQYEADLNALRASTIWRLSAPLRYAGSFLKKRRSRNDDELCSPENTAINDKSTTTARVPKIEKVGACQKSPGEATGELLRNSLSKFLQDKSEIHFGIERSPIVSIVVVVYNKAEYTLRCLQALHGIDFSSVELIVVDNGSTDCTSALLSSCKNVAVISLPENVQFVRGANIGAQKASGEFVLFLNNDTIVEASSVRFAVDRLRSSADIGAVGGAVLRLDGTLQEAGCIVWQNGHAHGYGVGDDPSRPEYRYAREVDYCSGAFLMVRRRIFEHLGGFDVAFAPAYYEDTDLCFRLRALGYSVVYEPKVELVHFEHVSSSAQAAQKLYETNRVSFVSRYAASLRQEVGASTKELLDARTSKKFDVKILVAFVESNEARGLEVMRLCERLEKHGVFVTLLCAEIYSAGYLALGVLGVEVIGCSSRTQICEILRVREEYYSLSIVIGKNDELAGEASVAELFSRSFGETGFVYLP